jgi:RecB family exonuclease
VRTSDYDLSATVWAVTDTVPLSTVERRFLDALRHSVGDENLLYRIGPQAPSDAEPSPPPPQSAAALFPDASRPDPASLTPDPVGRLVLSPEASLSTADARDLRFWTATGTRREVQAVFEDILSDGHPLDTVEIAYTTPDPYLPLLDSLAERYEVPISRSGGRAVDATRPGQLLRGLFDWIANDCPMSDLIALLRAGLLRLPTDADTSQSLDSRRAATLLAEKRYPDDCRKYAQTFDAWRASLESDANNIEETTDAPWTDRAVRERRTKQKRVRALKKVVTRLLKLAHMDDPSPVSPSEMADGAETLLETYGPTPPPDDSEDDRTPDQAARNRLIERLRTVQGTALDPMPAPQVARRLTTWLGLSPYVQAQRPRPGRAHVVPLESAGYADRRHLYVLGFDAASTASAVPDDPLLADAERSALSDEGRTLPLRRRQADADAWRTRRALARHDGPLTLSCSTHDLSEDEDRFEAPLFLRLKDAAQATRGVSEDTADPLVRHHGLAPDPDTPLSRLDRWASPGRPSPEAFDRAMEHHPGLRCGLDAAAARTSDTYTSHDGLLAPRSYPGLDPLSSTRPVSAGELEAYAQAPYAYFLRHVLGVEPLEEPALDDVAWLDARGRGAVLHETFHRFMAALSRQPTPDDLDRLRDAFEAVLEAKRDERPPPSEVVFASARRQLWNDARLFLRAEAARTDAHTPHDFERGFGYPPHRRRDEDDADAPTLDLGDLSFSLRGRIDRVDQLDAGAFSLWDYKTGSSRGYDEADLVGENFHLQWALYAYAYEALEDVTVSTAGYFFTSTDEMGKRVSAAPAAHREAVARVLRQVSDGITAGAFPVTDADALRYDYDRLFHDYGERRKQLTDKGWPGDRPAPPGLQSD